MEEYILFKFNDDINKDVVLLTSTEDLYFLQDRIFEELSVNNGNNFTVLVDLFLRNGFSFNRFVSLYFKGKNCCKSNIVNPREVSDEIKTKIRVYLKSSETIFEDTALSKNTIDFVKKSS